MENKVENFVNFFFFWCCGGGVFSNVNGDAYNNRLFSELVKLVNFVTF